MRSGRALASGACLTVTLSLLTVGPAHAAPGDLDTSFSGDGLQVTNFGGYEAATDVAVAGDGSIVVAGAYAGGFGIVRYHDDGSLDTAFGVNGVRSTGFGRSVAIQEDGAAIVAGAINGGIALARYLTDGSLDTSFGDNGTRVSDVGSPADISAVALQPDGRIVVAGGWDGNFAVARYTTDGSLDVGFGSGGTRVTDIGGADRAQALVIQPDGKIVAAGWGAGDFAVVRYNPDGSLDTGFGVGGAQRADFGGEDWATGVDLQPDGKIVAAGTANLQFAIARFTASGVLDPTFSDDGRQEINFSSLWGNEGRDVVVQPDGKSVVVGTCCWGDLGASVGLLRLDTDGSLDGTFGNYGMTGTNFGGADSGAASAVIHEGKVLAVGYTSDPEWTGDVDFALARFHTGVEEGTAPTNSTAPAISGVAQAGETLTVTAGTWSGTAPVTITNQWRRCDGIGAACTDVPGETAATLTLTSADVGHTLRVRETATNAYGTASEESPATAPVASAPAPPLAGGIAGTVRNKSNGQPIKDATVLCATGYSAKTANNGTYTIANVPSGTYTCTASANRYQSASQAVTVTADQTATVNFSLARK